MPWSANSWWPLPVVLDHLCFDFSNGFLVEVQEHLLNVIVGEAEDGFELGLGGWGIIWLSLTGP